MGGCARKAELPVGRGAGQHLMPPSFVTQKEIADTFRVTTGGKIGMKKGEKASKIKGHPVTK